MLVKALEPCFIDGQRRRAGAVFEYAGKNLPAHLVPVKGAVKEEGTVATKPIALSEMAMAEGKPKSFVDAMKTPKAGPKTE